MIIGKMDKRITLEKPVKIPDGQGGQEATHVPFIKVWAEFRVPNVKDLMAMGTSTSDMIQPMSIWRRKGVTNEWKVLYQTREFDVKHVYDPDKETTMLICEEIIRRG